MSRPKLAIIMDPIEQLVYAKDTSVAMLWEAKARGFDLYYAQPADLFYKNGDACALVSPLEVERDSQNWFQLSSVKQMRLAEFDVILMRKDPPVTRQYVYVTYLLEQAERSGVLVVNRPHSLRDCNEKMFTTDFPDLIPPMLVTANEQQLRDFLHAYQDIVVKPLHIMGGASIFRLRHGDANANTVFELLTENGQVSVMAQQYLPDIVNGDKRIILINGEPVPYALARVPQGDDWRGNLVLGAKGVVQALTKRDYQICETIAPELRRRGLYFVGIDVIGDYLTEINVTSPTGVRQIDEGAGLNISAMLFEFLETLLN